MPPFLAVALGGALGALTRYGVNLLALRLGADLFPWGTWTVNLLGCFLIGVAVPFVATSHTDTARLLVVTGFLGAFTTFSTFSLESLTLWTSGRPGLAALNVLGSVGAGLVCVVLGLALARGLGAS